jgi:hypothetical protein
MVRRRRCDPSGLQLPEHPLQESMHVQAFKLFPSLKMVNRFRSAVCMRATSICTGHIGTVITIIVVATTSKGDLFPFS